MSSIGEGIDFSQEQQKLSGTGPHLVKAQASPWPWQPQLLL